MSVAERSPLRNEIPRRSQHAVGAAFGRLRPQDASAGGAENEVAAPLLPGRPQGAPTGWRAVLSVAERSPMRNQIPHRGGLVRKLPHNEG